MSELSTTPEEYISSENEPNGSKKSKKKLLPFVGIGVGALCVISLVCVGIFGVGLTKVAKEKAPIEQVLDAYMRYMLAKDVDNAYALFSPRVQKQMDKSVIEELTEGNYYYLIEGYQNLTIQNIEISLKANSDPNMPQGTVATVSGTIEYEGGITGQFNGVLEKVDDEWLIDGFNVTVPPDKFPSGSKFRHPRL